MKRFRHLTGILGIVAVLFTVLTSHTVSLAEGSRSVNGTKDVWRETKFFPIQPHTEEWKQYSVGEIYEIMNPPEDMMDCFSSKELAELLAQWHEWNGFDYLHMYFEHLEDISLIFTTLLERPDGIHWMLKTYEACNMDILNGEIDYGPCFGEEGYDWRRDHDVEAFFSDFISIYIYDFTDEDIELYNLIHDEKTARYEMLTAERSELFRRRLYKDGEEMTKEEREKTIYHAYSQKNCEDYWRKNRDFPFAWGMVPAGYCMYNVNGELMPENNISLPTEIANPPEDVLSSLSTQELAGLALKMPWVTAMDLRTKDVDGFFDRASERYTIFQELTAKEDAIDCILNEYEKNRLYSYDVPNLTMEMIRTGNRYLLEELFVCRYIDRFKDKLTDADVERYLEIYKEKAETYDYIKDPAVRALFETELSLAEYGFAEEAYKPKDSGDFTIVFVEPTIMEEAAPAAPKEWVPKQPEVKTSEPGTPEVIEPQSNESVPPEAEPAKHSKSFMLVASTAIFFAVFGLIAFTVACRKKK